MSSAPHADVQPHLVQAHLMHAPVMDEERRPVNAVAYDAIVQRHGRRWETLGMAGEWQLVVLRDCCGTHDLPPFDDPVKSAIGTAETADDANALQPLVWGIGTLVTALIRPDFAITALLELPKAEMFRGLGDAAGNVPAVYRLLAKRQ